MGGSPRASSEWTLAGVSLAATEQALVEALRANHGQVSVGDPDSYEDDAGGQHVRKALRAKEVTCAMGSSLLVLGLVVDDRTVSITLGMSARPANEQLLAAFGGPTVQSDDGALWYDASSKHAVELRHEEQGWVLVLSDYGVLVATGMMPQAAFEANLSRLGARP